MQEWLSFLCGYATAYKATSDFNHAHFTLVDGQAPGFDEACLRADSTGDTHASKGNVI